MGIDSLQDVQTTRQLKELDAVAAEVRLGTKSMIDFEAIASELPDTEDVVLTVSFQRAQLARTRKSA